MQRLADQLLAFDLHFRDPHLILSFSLESSEQLVWSPGSWN